MSSISDLIKFAHKNNTPVIIHDREQDENFVLLNLDEYQNLKQDNYNVSVNQNIDEISKKDILNRINKDISMWRKKQELDNKKKAAQDIKDKATTKQTNEEFEQVKNLTKIAEQREDGQSKTTHGSQIGEKDSPEINTDTSKLQTNKGSDADPRQTTREIPKRSDSSEDEIEFEEIDSSPDFDEDVGASDISYEELDDEL
ncbi:MAG: hypothetical protein ABEJ24_02945 [Candidatus Magasanikbacteria bacterium]